MISILIPVYNSNISNLVYTLHKQLSSSKIDFEIICLDDFSTPKIIETNTVINKLSYTSYQLNPKNLGRNNTRQLLSEKANYDWILFLDADVLPKRDNFISTYISLIDSDFDAIYGGFAYYNEPPEKSFMLRWKYGRKYEEVDASKRNKRPYKSIISANFLIKKSVFNAINSKISGNLYGEDNHFGALLKSNYVTVKHINNEVYHLGIESSSNYLKKKEQAAITLLNLYYNSSKLEHDNDLLLLFEKSKKYRLNYLISKSFRLTKKLLQKNLTGNNPSTYLLQFYKIGFICSEDLKR